MNTCATCKHWVTPDDSLPAGGMLRNAGEQIDYMDAETDTRIAALRDRVRVCASPRLHFYIAPGDGEAAVIDGSEYMANLCTDRNFGCTLHEPNTPTGG